jgi:hypothetical protein
MPENWDISTISADELLKLSWVTLAPHFDSGYGFLKAAPIVGRQFHLSRSELLPADAASWCRESGRSAAFGQKSH